MKSPSEQRKTGKRRVRPKKMLYSFTVTADNSEFDSRSWRVSGGPQWGPLEDQDSENRNAGFVERYLKSFQENVIRAGPVASASYTLIGAIILLGGIGYALDYWRGTSPWFLLGGLLMGIIVGFYELAKAVWPHR